MSTASLVPCPACNQRRELKAIHNEKTGKGEIRSFHCGRCRETISYLMRGFGIEPIVVSIVPLE